MHARFRPFVPAAVAVRLGVDAPVLLQGRNEVRHELHRHDDLGAYRRADHMMRFGFLDLFFGERHHLAEGEREIERRVRDGAEIRVGARRCRVVVRNDREVDLLGRVGHAQV